jgi:hypothetical protein
MRRRTILAPMPPIDLARSMGDYPIKTLSKNIQKQNDRDLIAKTYRDISPKTTGKRFIAMVIYLEIYYLPRD